MGLQPHEKPPAHLSRNQARGEAAIRPHPSHIVILSDQSAAEGVEGPVVALAFAPRSDRRRMGTRVSIPYPLLPIPRLFVSGRERGTHPVGGSHAANRPPIFREIRHAAKPRPSPTPPGGRTENSPAHQPWESGAPRKGSLRRLRFFETNTRKLAISSVFVTKELPVFAQRGTQNYPKMHLEGVKCTFLRHFARVLRAFCRLIRAGE